MRKRGSGGGLFSRYGVNLKLAAAVAFLSFCAALIVGLKERRRGRPTAVAAARVLAGGSFGLIVVTTAWPTSWVIEWRQGGDLVLEPGMGGLRGWRTALSDSPTP